MTRHLDDFHRLLISLRDKMGARSMLLSQLGNNLRMLDPGFSPQAYGVAKLAELLAQVTDIGSVSKDDTGRDSFIFHGAVDESSHPGPTGHAPEVRIRKDIWDAVTSFRSPPGGWKLDLETYQIRSRDTDLDGLLDAEPERFIDLPDGGTEYQQNLAREFASSKYPQVLPMLDKIFEDPRWLSSFDNALSPLGSEESWTTCRKAALYKLVRTWADEHGISMQKIAAPPTQRKPTSSPARGISGNTADPTDEMRAIIHSAIDMMSAQELSTLAIPPIYLVMAAMRRSRS